MLDSAAPDPATKPVRSEPTERPARMDKAKPAKSANSTGLRPAEAKPVPDNASAKDGKATDHAGDAKAAKDGKASDTNEADPTAPSDSDSQAGLEFSEPASLFALMTDAAAPTSPDQPAVTVPPTVAAPPTAVATPTLPLPADAGAAQVSAPAPAPAVKEPRVSIGSPQIPAVATDGTSKPKETAPATSSDNAIEPQNASAEGDPTALPQVEAAADGKPRGSDEKAVAEFHRTFAELIAGRGKPDAAATDHSDTATATAPNNSATATSVPVQTNAPTAPATAANPASPQAQTPAVAVPLAGLAVEIATQAHAGKNHFDIRLDPPELGRINVKLDVDRDGNVATQLVVDRSDTLDLLKRDASTLERALQQAGLKTSDHGLNFSLSQHAFAEHDATPQNGAHMVVPDDDSAPLEALRQGYGRLLGLGGGLDIRV
jgi:flagellar hook-length control protein FliK